MTFGNLVKDDVALDSAPNQTRDMVEVYLIGKKHQYWKHFNVHSSFKNRIFGYQIFESLNRETVKTNNRSGDCRVPNIVRMRDAQLAQTNKIVSLDLSFFESLVR